LAEMGQRKAFGYQIDALIEEKHRLNAALDDYRRAEGGECKKYACAQARKDNERLK